MRIMLINSGFQNNLDLLDKRVAIASKFSLPSRTEGLQCTKPLLQPYKIYFKSPVGPHNQKASYHRLRHEDIW